MRKTRSWKHNQKTRKAWGTTKADKKATPFMYEDIDIDMWEAEMQYDNCDDGIDEE